MERLTKKDDGMLSLNCKICPKYKDCYDSTDCVDVLTKRLAAYEDKGQEPDNIVSPDELAKIVKQLKTLQAYKEALPLDRATELGKADKEGRVLVLPFKPGNTLFHVNNNVIFESLMGTSLCVSYRHGKGLTSITPLDTICRAIENGEIYTDRAKAAEAALTKKDGGSSPLQV